MRVFRILMLFLLFATVSRAADLTIGLIPEQNVFKQMGRYRPVGAYLEKRTGLTVEFTILPRYGNILESFREGAMDAAFWGSFTGALAIRKLGIEPIARPVWRDGVSTYHGYVFVRRDSGIRSVAEMEGKIAVFVDRATTAGYIFPVAYFREHGVEDLGGFFREHYFAGSHDAAITAVLDGEADVGAAKNTIYSMLAARDPRVERELLILARSPDVPSNGLGLRPDIPADTRKALKRALLEMALNPEGRAVLEVFGAREFVETSREDYEPVFDLAERAGIDLATYRYLNE